MTRLQGFLTSQYITVDGVSTCKLLYGTGQWSPTGAHNAHLYLTTMTLADSFQCINTLDVMIYDWVTVKEGLSTSPLQRPVRHTVLPREDLKTTMKPWYQRICVSLRGAYLPVLYL